MMLRVSAGRMVGRDDELRRLLTLLDDAEAGRSVAASRSTAYSAGESSSRHSASVRVTFSMSQSHRSNQ